ncbi:MULTISPECIES: hypothetical protein [unclassified Flavobacterium]|uniref:hypothetical protein n=1 Tax=unclassified Flavobacterium TaxID=196869 RepID=UPI0005504484|nr:hypothetical protein [Flavobacterium sp. ASV13]
MEDYYVRGTILKERKAVIAVTLPAPSEDNKYEIYKVYNLTDTQKNKILIHFKDRLGKPLEADDNLVSFVIDLTGKEFDSIKFRKRIIVGLYHKNEDINESLEPLEKIFEKTQLPHGAIPDSTGKGTIREGEEDGL